MNVGSLFARLSYGELSDIAMGMDGDGTISVDAQPKIISHANHALTLLYSRFTCNMNYVALRVTADTRRYHFDPLHNDSDTDVGNTSPRYLADTVTEPFAGDLIKILCIKDADGTMLPLNDTAAVNAVRTLTFNKIILPELEDDTQFEVGKLLTVEYQARHLELVNPADLAQEIELAPILEEALLFKIASRVFAGMRGEENMVVSRILNDQYEQVCLSVTDLDLLQNSTSDDHSRFIANGWV